MAIDFDSVSYYFPIRLRQALDAKGYSGKDLEDAGVVSASSIKEYVDGGRLPNLRMACRIADFLDVDLNWLCGFEEEPTYMDILKQDDRIAPWLR